MRAQYESSIHPSTSVPVAKYPVVPASNGGGWVNDGHSRLNATRVRRIEHPDTVAGLSPNDSFDHAWISTLLEQALDEVDGNRRMAAQKLGIGVRTLYRKLDEYGLK